MQTTTKDEDSSHYVQQGRAASTRAGRNENRTKRTRQHTNLRSGKCYGGVTNVGVGSNPTSDTMYRVVYIMCYYNKCFVC